MEKIVVFSKSKKETEKIGKILGEEILKFKNSVFLLLIGPLGSGKTTFVRGLISGLKIETKVISPTFLIIKEYSLKRTEKRFYHIDCYRLNSYRDLKKVGFEDLLAEKNIIVAIEWADKFLRTLKKKIKNYPWVKINFEYLDFDQRKIEFSFNNFVK